MRRRASAAVRAASSVAIALASSWLAAMAYRPARYEAAFYARGAWRRTVLVLATDVLGPYGALILGAALATAILAPWRVRVPRPSRRTLRAAALGAAIGAALVTAAIAWRTRVTPDSHIDPRGRPNLLLVDVGSWPEGAPSRAKAIAALAARGVTFDRAYASSPSTASARAAALDADLRAAGYDVVAVVGANDDEVARAAVAALRHAHSPFALRVTFPPREEAPPRWPYYRRHTDPAYRGVWKYDLSAPLARVDAQDRAQAAALAGAAVESADDAIGRIVATLAGRRLEERTAVVVTASVGAAAGAPSKAPSVADEARLHVPLVMRAPDAAPGTRVEAFVRDVDVDATLRAWAGAPPAPDGRPLGASLHGGALPPEPVFVAEDEDATPFGRRRAVRDAQGWLVYAPRRDGARFAWFPDAASAATAPPPHLEEALWTWMLRDGTLVARDGLLVPRAPAPTADLVVLFGDAAPRGLEPVASHAVTFTRAYAASESPIAARRALLTGVAPWEGREGASLLAQWRASGARVHVLADPSAPPLLGAEAHDVAPAGELGARAAAWIRDQGGAPVALVVDTGSKDADLAPLARALDATGRAARTIVVVATSAGTHASPLLVALPGVPPRTVAARVRTLDVAPTVLDVARIASAAREHLRGASLLALARGEPETDERAALVEGDARRTLVFGGARLVVRAAGRHAQLFDEDGKRPVPNDAASAARIADLTARLEAERRGVPPAGTRASLAATASARISLRFAGGGGSHAVRGTLTAHDASLQLTPVGLGSEMLRAHGPSTATFAFDTPADAVVGIDVVVTPADASVTWDLTLDGAPWPASAAFAGPYGVPAPDVRTGVDGDASRDAARAERPPPVDPARDLGLFVTRAR